MKFTKQSKKTSSEIEHEVLESWAKDHVFEKSVNSRPEANRYVFYDGPPFLTGTPHHGHLLISTIKDAVARYWTMNGKRVERRWGWDCHGLPAEVFVEKSLGIKNKKEIGTKISISDYVNACRAAMVKTGTEWEDTIDRIGRWVDFKGAYKTMDNEYMESVWWAFKELYEKGKIYEGEKILVYCTKDATPISKSEVAMENSYQKDTNPSVYVYFELENSDEQLLAWTTTPWTLPANVAVAVNPDIMYSLVAYGSKKVYVASSAVERVFTDEKHKRLEYSILKQVAGKDLVGKKYHPLFENRGPNSHIVLAADFVTADDGTGIVHEAPAYGEEDYELCKKNGIPVVSIVDENGCYTEGPWLEKNIWDVNKEIAKTLLQQGKALKVEYIVHDYPHCHRCGSKLMYRAHPSWFMDIQGQKQEMQNATSKTKWVPKALQTGRFTNIVETAPDWNLSRDRYWATPIPVWKGERKDGTEVVKVVGSYDEFKTLTGKSLTDYHLPNVMDVTFEVDGVELHHIGKVLDCWFESGSMPFAQFHYPFENKETFKKSFPADFIVEAVDQTRGWFYSLTAVNVALFGQAPYKNLICAGFINAEDGKKLSKKLKNYTDPVELMDKFSADSLRVLWLGSPLLNGEDIALKDRDVADTQRKLTSLRNTLDFFSLYAEADSIELNAEDAVNIPEVEHILDQWILNRLFEVSEIVNESMEKYDLQSAVRPLFSFIDDLSNWYVRRSRRRFWKSESDNDKLLAYKTLYFVLANFSKVLAPFAPFLADYMYKNLTGEASVHLCSWPNLPKPEENIIVEMSTAREYITEGLSQRASAGLKVRQPLSAVTVPKISQPLQDIILEELNVKTIKIGDRVQVDLKITQDLKIEGYAKELVRHVQSLRKTRGLDVSDHINLSIHTSDEQLKSAVEKYKNFITQETLAENLNDLKTDDAIQVEVDTLKAQINLNKF